MFRAELERAVPRADGTKGGRPAFDHVLMFKILLLQAMHGLSDERCEYLIKDRLSFMRFLGLGLADPVPDANTIWAFREALKRAGAVERCSRSSMHAARRWLPGDGRANRGRDHRRARRSSATPGGAGSHQGRADPRRWAEKPAKLRQKDATRAGR